jgi:hypothetical protein
MRESGMKDHVPTKIVTLKVRLGDGEHGGKVNEMGCHHKLEQYLDEYIAAAGITEDKKGPLFRAAIGRTGKLSERSMSRVDAWYMVRRRARSLERQNDGTLRPARRRSEF